VVARTRLSVTLYVLFLPCFNILRWKQHVRSTLRYLYTEIYGIGRAKPGTVDITVSHILTHTIQEDGRLRSALFLPVVRLKEKNSGNLSPELQNNQDLETVDTLLTRFRTPTGKLIYLLFTNNQYHVYKLLKQNATFRWGKC